MTTPRWCASNSSEPPPGPGESPVGSEPVAFDPVVHQRSFGELSAAQLHDILALRSAVFVVEQNCAYLDIDGHDRDPRTRHLWIERDGIAAYVRVLSVEGGTRIGRLVTRADARGEGLGAALVGRAVASSVGPWVLDAQAHLEAWYEKFGFVRTGPDHLDDGIPHVPMRRPVG